MSMPSSSELVATSAGSSPALSRCSTAPRSSRDSEPWCDQAISRGAPSLISRVIFSASRRLLVKTSVERASRIRVAQIGGEGGPERVALALLCGDAGQSRRQPHLDVVALRLARFDHRDRAPHVERQIVGAALQPEASRKRVREDLKI